MRFRAAALAAAACLAACFAALAWRGAVRSSATFDESLHMASGFALREAGRWLPGQPNPPLLLRWLAAPLPPGAKLAPLDLAACSSGPRTCGYNFLHSNTFAPDALLNRGRAANLLLGVLLALLSGWWAFSLGGPAAGLAALAVFAFMPPLLAHAALATADIGNALLCTASLWLLWRGRHSSALGSAAAAGFVCGLAMAGKYTAALLLPLSVFYLYSRPGRRFGIYAGWGAAALAGLWLGCLPYSPADWFRTARAVAGELDAGHLTYLLGRVSSEGSWYYFPLALLLKTPLPALLLAGAGFILLRGDKTFAGRLAYLAAPAAVWLSAGMVSNTQVGVRHILPLYPLLCVWAGLAAAKLWEGVFARRLAAALLFCWLAAGTIAASPWQLSYFNELAGGSAGGHRYFLDSNLDWGQGLKELGLYARERGASHIYLSYFGCADPRAYGLKYAPVLMTACAKLPGDGLPPAEGKKLLAVSATNRLGVYYQPSTLFGWLDSRRPEKIAGNSIWVYDVTGDTEALKMLSYPGLAQ